MAYSYSSTISANAGLSGGPSSVIMVDMPRIDLTWRMAWGRLPKRPKHMWAKFLLLLVASTLCFPESSPSETEIPISEPLLTTSSMSCMELEKTLRASYLAQGFHPYERDQEPLTYIVSWINGKQTELVGITATPPVDIDKWCITRKDSCVYKLGMKLHVTFARPRYGREHCEVP